MNDTIFDNFKCEIPKKSFHSAGENSELSPHGNGTILRNIGTFHNFVVRISKILATSLGDTMIVYSFAEHHDISTEHFPEDEIHPFSNY